ncbi:MAG: DUF5702 domain-containing protein [Lachnospiraceae bacterium]|nr:DUF5702 domain-containing protein [Lachnospiraceae bacterium]
MSNSMAISAADLALDSLLTNYDAELSEWYGMVASCQTIDEFYETSAEFFLRTLSSQGLTDDEITTISDYYADATGDDTIYDLLKIECQTETSAMITEVDDANLTNATFIKEDVLEFMKYRAPIELVSGLISRLSSDSSATDVTEAEKNEEEVQKKQDFYESEGKLYSAVYKTYCALMEYQDKVTSGGMSLDRLKGYLEELKEMDEAYSEIHTLMVCNLYNTQGLSVYSRVTKDLNAYITDSTCVSTSTQVYTRKSGDTCYISDTDAKALLDELSQAAESFEAAIDDFVEAAKNGKYDLYENMPADYVGDAANSIQWWARMNEAVNTSGKTDAIKTAAENLLKAYARVENMQSCTLESEDDTDWTTFLEEYTYSHEDGEIVYWGYVDDLKKAVEDLQKTYLKSGVTDSSDAYLVLVHTLETVSANNIDKIDPTKVTVSYNSGSGYTYTVTSALSYIRNRIKTIRTELENYVELLTAVIDGDDDKGTVKIDEIKDLVDDYNAALQDWSDEADEADTDMKRDDQADISALETEIANSITAESLEELKDRLVSIRDQYNLLLNAMQAMEYGPYNMEEIGDCINTGQSTTYKFLSDAASGTVAADDIPLINDELADYAASTFNALHTTDLSGYAVSEEDGSNPVINPRTGNVATPEMFVKWYQIFGEPKEEYLEKVEEAEEGEADAKDKAEEEKESAKKGEYTAGGSDIERTFSTENTGFSLGSAALSSLTTVVNSLINLDFTDMRDDLYVTTYIMSMFSYQIYENEGYYSLLSDEEQKALTLNNYTEKYEEKKGSESDEGTWLSTATTDTYNKSLTNQMINVTNNWAYGAEVEYILYGGSSNSDNLGSVNTSIFAIRYALNLVSGFTNFWSYSGENWTALTINSVANAIAAATGYIVPAAVVKVVLITVLTAFETSTDMKRLKAGFPVELYKTSYTDWWCGFNSTSGASYGDAMNSLGSGLGTTNQDKGIYYSDYLAIFVYLGLTDSHSAEGMYERLAEVIQANMWKILGVASDSDDSGDSDDGASTTDTYLEKFSMKKARLYFKFEATITVEPLLIKLPLFTQYDTSLQDNTDWCTYSISLMRGY